MTYVATVHLLIDAATEAEACDTVSSLLTEGGLYEDGSHLIDWSYAKAGDQYTGPRPVQIPSGYDRDEADLDAIARGKP